MDQLGDYKGGVVLLVLALAAEVEVPEVGVGGPARVGQSLGGVIFLLRLCRDWGHGARLL